MRHFANTLSYGTLYLVDDGTDTIRINDERKQNNPVYSAEDLTSKTWFKRFKESLGKKYIYWRGESAPKLAFFTCYDITVKPGDSLIKNDYSYLRYQSSASQSSDHVYFLGQSLIDDGYMTKENYLAYLMTVKIYFNDYNLLYIPHPRESADYVNMIKQELSIEVNRPDVPIEYEITIRRNRPKYLCSFFSSALINCSLLLNDTQLVKAFFIPSEHILPSRITEVVGYYNYFISNTDIEVIGTSTLSQ